MTERDAEALTDPRIRRLIERYAALSGATLSVPGRDLLVVSLPPSEQAFFAAAGAREAPQSVRLAFSLQALEADPDAHLAVVGSVFVERMTEAVRARGWRVRHGPLPSGASANDVSTRAAPVALRGCRALEPAVETVLHPLGRVLVRVAIRAGPEAEEELHASPIYDLAAGQPAPPNVDAMCQDVAAAGGADPPTTDLMRIAPSDPDVYLKRMISDIQSRTVSLVRRHETTVARHLSDELARLDRYYGDLDAEDPDRERDVVRVEHERRRAEATRRFAVRGTLHPLQLEEWLVAVERVRWRLLADSGIETELAAWRYLIAGEPRWRFACPSCGSEPEWATICSGSHVACSSCASFCSVCGEACCATHGLAACHVDAEPVCTRHSFMCPGCERRCCSAHQAECVAGRHLACRACVAACSSCGRAVCASHATASVPDAPLGSRRLCQDCVVHCEGRTSEPVGRDESAQCGTCMQFVCTRHQSACAVDQQVHCSRHLRRSDHSRRLLCEAHRAACGRQAEEIVGSDEVGVCFECGMTVCDRHADRCVGHDERFCVEHLRPLHDTRGEMGCSEHRSVCQVDAKTYSLAGTSPCPICSKPTCRSHQIRCHWCGRPVCVHDLGAQRHCATCRGLEATWDLGEDLLHASLSANRGQPMKVRGWRATRDAGHRVVEADLGWGRKVVFTVPHGEAALSTMLRHGVFGTRRIK